MSSHQQLLLISACILGFGSMEFVTRRYQASVSGKATANDAWLEVLMFVSLVAITQPIALLGSNALCNWLMPAQHNAWANLPWWAMTGLLLIGDDLTQYLSAVFRVLFEADDVIVAAAGMSPDALAAATGGCSQRASPVSRSQA